MQPTPQRTKEPVQKVSRAWIPFAGRRSPAPQSSSTFQTLIIVYCTKAGNANSFANIHRSALQAVQRVGHSEYTEFSIHGRGTELLSPTEDVGRRRGAVASEMNEKTDSHRRGQTSRTWRRSYSFLQIQKYILVSPFPFYQCFPLCKFSLQTSILAHKPLTKAL